MKIDKKGEYMDLKTRDFSMLGYTMAITEYLLDTEDEKLKWRVSKLLEAAREIASIYKGDGMGNLITPRKVKQIEKKVSDLTVKLPRVGNCGTEKQKENLIINFAFILCILDEILRKSKNKPIVDKFEVLNKRIVWCNEYVDSKLDKFGSYIRGENIFNNWIKG